MAKAVHKADPSITIETARANVMKANPELYDQAMKDGSAGLQ